MMQNVSPLGWAAIIFIILVIVILNAGLIAFLRYRPTLTRKMPKQTQSAQDFNRLVEVVKDPFGEQRKQMEELSGLVGRLQNPPKGQDDA